MKTLLKIIAGIIGLVIVVMVGLGVAISIYSDDIKDLAVAKVSEHTGRDLHIEEVGATFFPWKNAT